MHQSSGTCFSPTGRATLATSVCRWLAAGFLERFFCCGGRRLSAAGYGLLLVPGAIGGIAGSMLAQRLTSSPLRIVLTLAIMISGIATWITSALSAPVAVGLLSALAVGAVMVWNVLTLALRQRVIPDYLLGRVGASYRFILYFGVPFGAMAGGFIATAFGLRTTLAVSGIALTAIGLAIPFLLRDHNSASVSG